MSREFSAPICAGGGDAQHYLGREGPYETHVGAHRAQSSSTPLCQRLNVVMTKLRGLIQIARKPYRPELHYMRGPGPKSYAKHQARIEENVSRAPSAELMLSLLLILAALVTGHEPTYAQQACQRGFQPVNGRCVLLEDIACSFWRLLLQKIEREDANDNTSRDTGVAFAPEGGAPVGPFLSGSAGRPCVLCGDFNCRGRRLSNVSLQYGKCASLR